MSKKRFFLVLLVLLWWMIWQMVINHAQRVINHNLEDRVKRLESRIYGN